MDGSLTAEQQKQASFIRRSAESLLEMVNDLLDLARVEAGKTMVRPGHFTVPNLFAALQGVLKPLRGVIRPLAAVEDVDLIFEDASEIPQLYTDETKVTQILRNFVSNALKFTERGEVRVRAELTPDGKMVVFSVADTGLGIPQAHLETIFQEFSQVDSPMQKKVIGSGLGLPLARALAQVLGGGVRVESVEGKGSTFYAEIPLEYAEEPAAAAPPDSAAQILLIDDEEVSRYLVRQALGPSVIFMEASDGTSGIEMARKRRPLAILLDLRMPQMNGFEVLRELKADPATTGIPVTIMTAQALTHEQRAILEELAATVLSKELLSQPGGAEHLRKVLLGERGVQ
jgi:CheY-like chemotaxis protein/anti-sigma regulatory factor (Ser/Thr protein kinase)